MCNQLSNLQYLKEGDDKLLKSYKNDLHKANSKNNILRTIISLCFLLLIALFFGYLFCKVKNNN